MPGRTLWVDLSMGAWSPRHAAGEVMAQLGLPIDAVAHDDDNGAINQGVDREARGDGARLTAYADARRVLASLTPADRVRVMRPRWGLPVRSDNRLFLRYLHALGVPVTWIGARAKVGPVPCSAALSLFPGLLPRSILALLDIADADPLLCALSDDLFLIDGRARVLDPRRHPQVVDRLTELASHAAPLQGYGDALGSALFVDAVGCVARARRCVATSPDLALSMAARARACARTPLEAATVELHRQGIRIFLHRFADAAAVREPSPRLPPALRAELLLMRGWGRVMIGDHAEAERCFAASGAVGARADAADQLYRRNILALALFRSGHVGRALAIEEEIAETLAAQGDPDPQLQFVNAINLARLHRASGDPCRYRQYLAQAFATSDNVRSATEILQLNLLLSEAAASTDPEDARAALLRAAFAWLAAEPCDAIGIRALRLFPEGAGAHPRRVDELVSRHLDRRLADTFPEVSPLTLDAVPQVLLTDAAPGVRADALLEARGVCLLRSAYRAPALPRANDTRALAARAFAILAVDPVPQHGCWLIDTAAGLDVAGRDGPVQAARWRHGLRADRSPTLGIGPAVRRIERGRRVIFRRHLHAVDLDDQAAEWVARVARRPVGMPEGPTPLIADLIERRVVGMYDAA